MICISGTKFEQIILDDKDGSFKQWMLDHRSSIFIRAKFFSYEDHYTIDHILNPNIAICYSEIFIEFTDPDDSLYFKLSWI